ncbi:hypothetical protein F443_12474 [Phytophthora nicotianae P1569]|uniref:Uncharacterized protein n=2 Tax=Phytophthora nicotianae TaxID=4792 RepID=V9ET29_PHYNI|nr:hypothetical protein F443_12474 [Phytophthora nicotianae P1569]
MSTRCTNRNQAAPSSATNKPAAQGVEPPPIIALHDDPAVPQVPVQQANAGGAPEPDDEPNPAQIGGGGVDDGTDKRPRRIDLKT